MPLPSHTASGIRFETRRSRMKSNSRSPYRGKRGQSRARESNLCKGRKAAEEKKDPVHAKEEETVEAILSCMASDGDGDHDVARDAVVKCGPALCNAISCSSYPTPTQEQCWQKYPRQSQITIIEPQSSCDVAPKTRWCHQSESANRCGSHGNDWDVRPQDLSPDLHHHDLNAMYAANSRQVCVANLPKSTMKLQLLRNAFKQLFNALPQFVSGYRPGTDPVESVSFRDSQVCDHAHVNFIDPILASTAIDMNGFEFFGTPLQVERVRGLGYVPPGGHARALDVTPLQEAGFLPSAVRNSSLKDVYIGNLPMGTTGGVIHDLLESTCIQLPEYRPDKGPPILKVSLVPKHFCAFVTFQNWKMTSRIIDIFDGLCLVGSKLRVRHRSHDGQ